MRHPLARAAALVFLALSAGCKSNDTTTTAPTTTTKTETFNGTVQVRSSDMHSFSVSASGQVSVTLTAAGPPATIPMGVGIGTPADAACGIITGGSVTAVAGTNAQLTGVVSPGTLCVSVFDVGNQTSAITYTVTVSHP
jgi:hypothetical protein